MADFLHFRDEIGPFYQGLRRVPARQHKFDARRPGIEEVGDCFFGEEGIARGNVDLVEYDKVVSAGSQGLSGFFEAGEGGRDIGGLRFAFYEAAPVRTARP